MQWLKVILILFGAPLACVIAGVVAAHLLDCIVSSIRMAWLDLRLWYSRRKDNR